MDEERTQFQKVILMILAAMIVLFGVLTGVSRAHKGVLFEETLLKVSAAAEQAVYSGEAHGDPVTITVTPGQRLQNDGGIRDRRPVPRHLHRGIPAGKHSDIAWRYRARHPRPEKRRCFV